MYDCIIRLADQAVTFHGCSLASALGLLPVCILTGCFRLQPTLRANFSQTYGSILSTSITPFTVMLQAVNQHKEESALSPTQLSELADEVSKDDDVMKKCSPEFITALWYTSHDVM